MILLELKLYFKINLRDVISIVCAFDVSFCFIVIGGSRN